MSTSRPSIDAIWRRFDDFDLPEPRVDLCPYAQAFHDWAVRAHDLGRDPSIISVKQAKIWLIDKYFDWYSIAPRQHRYHLNPRGHTCIFQVFVEFYQQLRALELSLTPLVLIQSPPPPPPPPPPPRIAGIPFAEILGEEK